MAEKILVFLGHPDNNSYCGALADSYVKGAKASGADVRYLRIGDMDFKTNLKHGYNVVMELEDDLVKGQQYLKWADHIVFVFPTWWGSLPASFKGFFDRALLPGFGFKYPKGAKFPDKLLKGKTGRLIVTMDTPPWFYKFMYSSPGINAMKKMTLEYCGVKPVKVTQIGSVKEFSNDKREHWIEKIEQLGRTKG
ncbi:NAD(P)H-dependent oxidoreductase [Cytobacillus sp. Hm23]